MIDILRENAGTIIVSLILIGVVVRIVVKMYRDRKQGKSSCGCSCGCCSVSGTCHEQGKTGGGKG